MSNRPSQLFRNLSAKIASIPMILTAVVVFLGGTIWTVVYSFTDSRLLPRLRFVGLDQYERLWSNNRWLLSIENLAIYGILSLIFSLVIGFLLAALLDQKIRFEDTFRTIYPLPLRALLHRHRPGLAVAPEPRLRHPERDPFDSASRASPSTRSTTPTSSSTAC